MKKSQGVNAAKPNKKSKGFDLPPELLAVIGGGSYDNIDLKNKGGQAVKLTRFGSGFDSIDVSKSGALSLTKIPGGADAGGAGVELTKSSKGGKKIKVDAAGVAASLAKKWAGLPTAGKAAVIAGAVGVVLVGGAVVAMK